MSIKHILYIFLAGFLVACQEKIELDLTEEGKKVTVEAYVCTEIDSSYVKLSFSAPFLNQNAIENITNASVQVVEEANPNPIVFTHVDKGLYRAPAGFKGNSGKNYELSIIVDGITYKSTSRLDSMFTVDPDLRSEFRAADGFIEEGYAITYFSIDNRSQPKYTWFQFGKNDTINEQEITFDNVNITTGQSVPFELPFFRPVSGDSVMLIFRSVDRNVYDYLNALFVLRSAAPGPFQTPPANPPTNISNGAIGYFVCSDVVRVWKKLP